MDIKYNYEVPNCWYKDVYIDKSPCVKAARSFCLLNENKIKECFFLIHGYRGYPGELVRPAIDIYELGYDVYVPRFPGNGTSGDDFINSKGKDWLKFAQNVLDDLKTKYDKIHLLGHSMGTPIASIIGCNDNKVGKIIYAAPSYENRQMPLHTRIYLRLVSPFKKRIYSGWKSDPRYHLHYDKLPYDSPYLGKEYWSYYFPGQLIDYYSIMKKGLKMFKEHPHDHLIIYPLTDILISKPSVELMLKVNPNANVAYIEKGSHCIFYDKEVEAENKAVEEIIKYIKQWRHIAFLIFTDIMIII